MARGAWEPPVQGARAARRIAPMGHEREIRITWPVTPNEHGGRMLWFGSWLVGDAGVEGPWFYTGRGGCEGRYRPPPAATGVRIRRWPNEGFDAEFADLLELDAIEHVFADDLDFDTAQRFNHLTDYESWPKV